MSLKINNITLSTRISFYAGNVHILREIFLTIFYPLLSLLIFCITKLDPILAKHCIFEDPFHTKQVTYYMYVLLILHISYTIGNVHILCKLFLKIFYPLLAFVTICSTKLNTILVKRCIFARPSSAKTDYVLYVCSLNITQNTKDINHSIVNFDLTRGIQFHILSGSWTYCRSPYSLHI